MTNSEQPYSIIPRIFELISDLTEDQQIDLLRQLLKDNITNHLFKLVVSIPEDQQETISAFNAWIKSENKTFRYSNISDVCNRCM